MRSKSDDDDDSSEYCSSVAFSFVGGLVFRRLEEESTT